MKVLFDTSVLVASMVEPHPMHNRALPWLRRAIVAEFVFCVASHTLAELYAVLTTLPVSPRISPSIAWRLINDDIMGSAEIVSLSPSDYSHVIRHMYDLGLSGGIIYDALIARAAQKAKVDQLLTLNPDDFKHVWPEGASQIYVP